MLAPDEDRLSLDGLKEEDRLAIAISASVDMVGLAFRGVIAAVGVGVVDLAGDGNGASSVSTARAAAGEDMRSIVSVQIALRCHLLRLVN